MATPLRVLLLEDQEADAQLILRELRAKGFEPDWKRVDNEADYAAALNPGLDLILADFSLPQFDAIRALELLNRRDLDTPFIVVSGAIGEDMAVRVLQLGAHDYLLKDRLSRLKQAIDGALAAKRFREEKRRDEESLRQMNEKLQSLVRSSPLAIIVVDRDLNVLEWNPAAERVFGWSHAEVQGLPIPVIPASQQAEIREILQNERTAETTSEIKAQRLRKDGSLVDVTLWSSPLRDGQGRIAASMILYADITERVRLEEQVRQAQKMEAIGRLAGGVAHDFNNILTVIGGICDVVLEGITPTNPLSKDIIEIKRAADRAASLTRQLLAFSRRQILSPRVLDLNVLVRDMHKMLVRLLGADIELRLTLADNVGPIEADPGQLEQILLNLAVNARDAMPEGGIVLIETRNATHESLYVTDQSDVPQGEQVTLAVTDTGSGMDAATKAHLFEPFFTTKTEGRGTGLGLATVYGIVKQSHGSIAVYSEPGQGTAFRISFPRAGKPPVPTVINTVKPSQLSGSETILLAEDEESLRKLAERVLSKHGYHVLTAKDGADAVTLLETYAGRIDLLITDVVMPKVGGRQVAAEAARKFPNIKVLYMSGHTEDGIFLERVVAADVSLLRKPFSPETLAGRVRHLLDSHLAT